MAFREYSKARKRTGYTHENIGFKKSPTLLIA